VIVLLLLLLLLLMLLLMLLIMLQIMLLLLEVIRRDHPRDMSYCIRRYADPPCTPSCICLLL
jgi:hypothetical protein